MLPAQPNQSLIDGMACLQWLASVGRPVGCREAARALNLETTRVNRLLRTLTHLGMAQQTPQRKYRPGPAIHVLAAQALFGSRLLSVALEPLESLQRFGLVVALGVRWRDQISYLYHATPGMKAGEALGRVGLFPAAQSSIGVALLAQTTRQRSADLTAARKLGYACIRPSPNHPAHRSLAFALPEPHHAGIALAGTFPDAQLPELVEALRQTVAAITARLDERQEHPA